MKAIVLSCDKYHPMAHHMILTYKTKWPSNKFTFRVPWNSEFPSNIKDKFGECIEPVKSDIEFKKTIYTLIEDLDDDEWVYWCIDDKYLIDIDESIANEVTRFVESNNDPELYGVTFGFVGEIRKRARGKPKIKTNEDLTFILRKPDYHQWLHQFYRVKVLKAFCDYLIEPPKYKAKQMDYHKKLPDAGKYLTLSHNIITCGESTSRGKITKNCVTSFSEYGLELPTNFETTTRKYIHE